MHRYPVQGFHLNIPARTPSLGGQSLSPRRARLFRNWLCEAFSGQIGKGFPLNIARINLKGSSNVNGSTFMGSISKQPCARSWAPKYRANLSNPLLLEETLVRHPKLRLWLAHAGWPMLDKMINMLFTYPQLHADVSFIN